MQGRVTLSPLAHADPIGTLLLPILSIFTTMPLLGWGRPVQTNPVLYTRKLRMKTGHMLVAAAGPAMNLILGALVTIILALYVRALPVERLNHEITSNLTLLARLNLGLMFFNLLPLPPLDGGAVLRGLLPDSAGAVLEPLNRYGGIILLALFYSGALVFILSPADWVIRQWFQLWGLRLA
jgi:Zn-dependent protease